LYYGVLVGTALMFVLGGQPHLQSNLDAELLAAVRKGDVNAAAALVKKGADVNVKSEYGVAAIMFAAEVADLEMVKLLLSHGADPNAHDIQVGDRALNLVADHALTDRRTRAAREAIVELLVDKTVNGGMALDHLINQEYFDAALKIVRRGGDIDPVHLNVALRVAKRKKHAELTQLLIDAGAKDPGPADSARFRPSG
jgi:ankyrin repeat protein